MGVSFSAFAMIFLNVVMKSIREIIFCTIICRAGDSNHSFTLKIKINKDHLIFVRPLFILRCVMGQLFA